MNMCEKIKIIRKAEELTQKEFSEEAGLSISAIKKYETGRRTPNGIELEKITKSDRFKKYTLWLMTDEVAPEAGQISPEIEEQRKLSNG
ncbi:helix-turn-helix domain-containing protein [Alkalimarinus coralli]|uniref:helix-turn-helix domain-containing protein n=1 Tax=Alkalimarinus coralli TaxID=2935863 RepID=UPI00202B5F6E|nr:helix-turn-helix transcriptional regulator [Alkalimarinus coralli]